MAHESIPAASLRRTEQWTGARLSGEISPGTLAPREAELWRNYLY